MEDGSDGLLSSVQVSDHMKNGVVSPIMANFPEGTVTNAKDDKTIAEPSKVNGDSNETQTNLYLDSYSSESDALVIDESVPKKRKIKSKFNKKSKENNRRTSEKENEHDFSSKSDLKDKYSDKQVAVEHAKDVVDELESNKIVQQTTYSESDTNPRQLNEESQTKSDSFSANSDDVNLGSSSLPFYCDQPRIDSEIISSSKELLTHSNPYFHESLFELSQLHHACDETSSIALSNKDTSLPSSLTLNKSVKRNKPKPKLKEYAQYLGLQPAIQFKCSKCGKSGFESLLTLQDHLIQCNSVQSFERNTENENFSSFKLTRKVFLCSSCGTYYENWNLYLHMLEFHRRYICLYCLGMFSILDDLCQHIQSRHNLEPGVKNTLDEFYNVYNEPCYVICCECNRLFNEQDNFFYHNCVPQKLTTKAKPKLIKQLITPENHVTGDSGATVRQIEKETEVVNEPEKGDSVETSQKENIPEKHINLEGVNNKTNSKQQKPNDTETKKCVNDNSENGDNSNSVNEKQLITDKTISDESNVIETKASDQTEEESNLDISAETCEQDSLDSPKISKEIVDHHSSADNTMDNTEENLPESTEIEEPVETRKVPKLSLKLPKPGSYPEPDLEDSDDSDKLAMEVDNIESENETEAVLEETETVLPTEPQIPVAELDVPVVELELEQPIDKMDIQILLQKCLRATAPTCIYCNHSRRIAVNGKQLGLHAIAEHRYSAIVKSITAEELIPESFVSRIKECLDELETVFFNLDSGASDEAVTFSHVFECFQCHYSTTVHKELYLHNRKFHSKNLLLCIMCKSNFYSYSELICHLCPGVYVLDFNLQFRCCMCVSDDLPSAFRLMVHLRKRHNVCDVCLEMCHGQYKLSNHVWKHKLHHFCYRCGIAYRNKPDITRHLFWKHGTESVLCKKCLQKKWPHVYHFCVPPPTFTCEECNLVFTQAVSLKVHKRLHTEEKKHHCTWEDCMEAFISKKLMLKHLKRHTDPPEEETVQEEVQQEEDKEMRGVEEEINSSEVNAEEEPPKPVKPKVDVYDLPALNLSESDTSDSESEAEKPLKLTPTPTDQHSSTELKLENPDHDSVLKSETKKEIKADDQDTVLDQAEVKQANITGKVDDLQPQIDYETSSTVMQNIWDNFKNYQASKEKMDHMFTAEVEKVDQPYVSDIPIPVVEEGVSWELALRDHDYCADPEKKQTDTSIIEVKPALELTERVDHDYCFQIEKHKEPEKPTVEAPPKIETPIQEDLKKSSRKRTNSSSSSSTDTDSSCSCGSNCSCSSSSGSSSSTSDSSNSDSSTEEGRRRQQARRIKRKQKGQSSKVKQRRAQAEIKVDIVTTNLPPVVIDMPIQESDLETTESETDEEFYDREPQKFAKKILEEKRAQLLAEMGPHMVPNGSFIESTSRPPTPPAGTVEEDQQPKKKKKTKKRKKRKSEKKLQRRTYSATLIMDPGPVPQSVTPPYYQQYHHRTHSPTVAPITLSLSRNSPIVGPQTPPQFVPSENPSLSRQDSNASDSSLRASKRRRVPNRFYGYSSDEDEKTGGPSSAKSRKVEVSQAPLSPMLVPPITIKTVPSPLTLPPRPPTVEPITLRLPRPTHPPNDPRSQRRPTVPPIRLAAPRPPLPTTKEDSATESNESDTDDPQPQIREPPKPPQPQLYCYCRCPYDEVSEMIGCDSNDCQIEWFHFECVGIMVPPKGQWFCPDCRKKKQQQRRELLQA